MGFRTIEITGPAELHVRSGSLVIEKELKADSTIPVSDSGKTPKRGKKQKVPEISKLLIPLDDISTINRCVYKY